MAKLEDSFGRRFYYLRLSITDACNFRCVYCLPNGYKQPKNEETFLSLAEIKNLTRAFSAFGVRKIRITGGEPLLRRDLTEIVSMIRAIPSIEKIALSTNGYRLSKEIDKLVRAGVSAVNISLDSLNPAKFAGATGTSFLPEVLEGIDASLKYEHLNVKVNAVLMNGVNHDETQSFLDWIRTRSVTVRFIELMPTGQNQAFFGRHHVKSDALKESLVQLGWTPIERAIDSGPAIEFSHPEYQGRIGVISPYAKDFCASCNRLRVTSRGALRLCLFGEGGTSVRHLLQRSEQQEELKEYISALLMKKDVSHYLPEGKFGNNQTFSSMGG